MNITLQIVMNLLETVTKGANIILEWERPCKVRKSYDGPAITKRVKMVGRTGIEYDNIKSVQEKRENGTLPAENNGLPWGTWLSYPHIIEHKGNHYVRLYNGTSKLTRPCVTFFQGGVEVAKEAIESFLLSSELRSEHGDTFTCNISNMLRIHEEIDMQGEVSIETQEAQVEEPA